MIGFDTIARLVSENLATDEFDPKAFFEERGIDSFAVVRAAMCNVPGAHQIDTNAGIAAVFVQGVQLGVLIAEETRR